MRHRLTLIALLAWPLGCTGEFASPRGREGAPAPAVPSAGAEPARTTLVTGPQLRRLSRAEYHHTVDELFARSIAGLEVPLELSVAGSASIAGAQQVGFADTGAFLEAAERAADVVADSVEAQLGSCAAPDCTRTWATGFLARAFRGPVEDGVVTRYAALLTSPEAGASRLDRVKTFLLAALSSPHFLYRKEIGTEVVGSNGALRALTGAELASRLSYLVWQSPPDAALTAAAQAGALENPVARGEQLTRMLADAKANRGFRAFVRDWMALEENKIPSKTSSTLEGTAESFAADAETALALLVDDVVGRTGGKFAELLSTDRAYVNAGLAPFLGVASTSASFERVQLTDGKRLGVLAQPLVLSAHTKESGVSPFILGKFLLENVTCEEVGNPPAVFPTVEEPPGSSKTLRQELEERTRGPACISCHERIGPAGFAFLPFDPIGRHRAADGAGRPFDTAGTLTFARSKETVRFADAPGLSRNLAASADLKKCVARRLFRFTHGRYESANDAAQVAQLEDTAVDTDTRAERLIRQLVLDEAFARVPVSIQ